MVSLCWASQSVQSPPPLHGRQMPLFLSNMVIYPETLLLEGAIWPAHLISLTLPSEPVKAGKSAFDEVRYNENSYRLEGPLGGGPGQLEVPFFYQPPLPLPGQSSRLYRHILHSLVMNFDLAISLFSFFEVTPVFFSSFQYWNLFFLQRIAFQPELWRLTSSFWVLSEASPALDATCPYDLP